MHPRDDLVRLRELTSVGGKTLGAEQLSPNRFAFGRGTDRGFVDLCANVPRASLDARLRGERAFPWRPGRGTIRTAAVVAP
jgi:hypothetical protein